jgi:membrane protease YdiL (CAAX protease family)
MSSGGSDLGWRWVPPPGWPEPPPGWTPYPGWRPPADWPEPPRDWTWWVPTSPADWLDRRHPLDREVAAGLAGSSWGLGEVGKFFGWYALLTLVVGGIVALLAVYLLVGSPAGVQLTDSIATLVGESGIGVAVLLAGRKAARQSGGWRAALGWSLPRLRDAWVALRWLLLQYGVRVVLGVLLALLIPALRHETVSNTGPVKVATGLPLALLLISAVLVAPVVEEFAFRGLILRAALRRMRFWWAAALSSILFGILHMPEGANAVGAVVLLVLMTGFGVLQCVLVRRVGRLAPGMLVHAAMNAVAVAGVVVLR